MAITTRDGLIAAMATGKSVNFFKINASAVAGFQYTHFRNSGKPAPGSIPSTAAGRALDRTSAGAMPIPAPAATSYVTAYSALLGSAAGLILADRLVETGTLDGTVTTAQTVNSVALPARATGAIDVELWLETYTAFGTTATPTITASYTNQSGTAGRTATLNGGFPSNGGVINRTYQMTLEAGDTGVQSVQSVTLATSTGLAGAFGVVLRRTLLSGATAVNNAGFNQGYAETGLQKLADDSCVEMLTFAATTSSGTIMGGFTVSQG